MKTLLATFFLCSCLATAVAQAGSRSSDLPKHATTAKASPASRSECVLSVGLCVSIPASWKRLGDVFDDLGFVVAEAHPGTDAASWPQLTVAAVALPPQKNGDAPSLDSVVEIVLTPDGSFTSAETIQRTHLLLNGSNAEIIRVLLHDEAGNANATEAVALIEGEDGLVYSIALRCAPEEFTRLEAIFQRAIHSWHIKPSAEQSVPPSKPTQEPVRK